MTLKVFDGTSETGDFSAALNAAVESARDGLSFSEYVWRLDSVWGNSTGFVKVSLVAASTVTVAELISD